MLVGGVQTVAAKANDESLQVKVRKAQKGHRPPLSSNPNPYPPLAQGISAQTRGKSR